MQTAASSFVQFCMYVPILMGALVFLTFAAASEAPSATPFRINPTRQFCQTSRDGIARAKVSSLVHEQEEDAIFDEAKGVTRAPGDSSSKLVLVVAISTFLQLRMSELERLDRRRRMSHALSARSPSVGGRMLSPGPSPTVAASLSSSSPWTGARGVSPHDHRHDQQQRAVGTNPDAGSLAQRARSRSLARASILASTTPSSPPATQQQLHLQRTPSMRRGRARARVAAALEPEADADAASSGSDSRIDSAKQQNDDTASSDDSDDPDGDERFQGRALMHRVLALAEDPLTVLLAADSQQPPSATVKNITTTTPDLAHTPAPTPGHSFHPPMPEHRRSLLVSQPMVDEPDEVVPYIAPPPLNATDDSRQARSMSVRPRYSRHSLANVHDITAGDRAALANIETNGLASATATLENSDNVRQRARERIRGKSIDFRNVGLAAYIPLDKETRETAGAVAVAAADGPEFKAEDGVKKTGSIDNHSRLREIVMETLAARKAQGPTDEEPEFVRLNDLDDDGDIPYVSPRLNRQEMSRSGSTPSIRMVRKRSSIPINAAYAEKLNNRTSVPLHIAYGGHDPSSSSSSFLSTALGPKTSLLNPEKSVNAPPVAPSSPSYNEPEFIPLNDEADAPAYIHPAGASAAQRKFTPRTASAAAISMLRKNSSVLQSIVESPANALKAAEAAAAVAAAATAAEPPARAPAPEEVVPYVRPAGAVQRSMSLSSVRAVRKRQSVAMGMHVDVVHPVTTATAGTVGAGAVLGAAGSIAGDTNEDALKLIAAGYDEKMREIILESVSGRNAASATSAVDAGVSPAPETPVLKVVGRAISTPSMPHHHQSQSTLKAVLMANHTSSQVAAQAVNPERLLAPEQNLRYSSSGSSILVHPTISLPRPSKKTNRASDIFTENSSSSAVRPASAIAASTAAVAAARAPTEPSPIKLPKHQQSFSSFSIANEAGDDDNDNTTAIQPPPPPRMRRQTTWGAISSGVSYLASAAAISLASSAGEKESGTVSPVSPPATPKREGSAIASAFAYFAGGGGAPVTPKPVVEPAQSYGRAGLAEKRASVGTQPAYGLSQEASLNIPEATTKADEWWWRRGSASAPTQKK
ncbi:hypothetical protein BC830DRAFT_1164652 [Chytriomyces sp. MP71]|nr:hypothetical protein BC830DRAFT_1164652 [Chytriomyces sp. MP71]